MSSIHPDIAKLMQGPEPEPEPESPYRERNARLVDQAIFVARECPDLMAFLDVHTEVDAATPAIMQPRLAMSTGETLAYAAGQRSIFRWLRDLPNQQMEKEQHSG